VTGDPPTTLFSKVAGNIDVRALLTFTAANGASQPLYISGARPTALQLDALQMPPLPPAGLDVRTDSRTRYAFDGENILRVQGNGRLIIAMAPTPGSDVSCMLFDDNGATLATFDGMSGGSIDVTVQGSASYRLRVLAKEAAPTVMTLGQNYPNPFTTETGTTLPVTLTAAQDARLVVTDMLGRTVRTLLLGMQPAGTRLIAWDGRNDAGESVPAGTYLYRFEAGGRQLFKSLSIMK
jgi:hypothetical protein